MRIHIPCLEVRDQTRMPQGPHIVQPNHLPRFHGALPLPRTPVNKGKKKGRSPIRLAPSPLSVPFGGKGLALIHSRGPLAAALRRSSAGLLQRIRSIGRYTLNASPLKRSTFSQSEATTSFVSATTRSKPLPHVTMSGAVAFRRRLATPITSVPAPPESLSKATSRSGPSNRRSLPSSPTTLSESQPPMTISLPGPPKRFLWPLRASVGWVSTQSLPGPPSRVSRPLRAKSLSLPPLPRRLSFPLVPLRVSGPLVPILVRASATPLAKTSVAAITVNRRITRRILHSFPSKLSHRSSAPRGRSGKPLRAG